MIKNKLMLNFATLAFVFTIQASHADTDEIVEFRIKAGTGGNPWNTMESIVEVQIGQTLRFINDDTVDHQLHTFGKPCPHQDGVSKPGEFYDCKISTPVDPRIDIFYDHNFGSTSRFFMKTVK